MEIRHKKDVTSCCCSSAGLSSAVLLDSEFDCFSRMNIVWVDLEENQSQKAHSHNYEQIYVIMDGLGRVEVGEEKREVKEGDLIVIPSGAKHRIYSNNSKLSYLTIANKKEQ